MTTMTTMTTMTNMPETNMPEKSTTDLLAADFERLNGVAQASLATIRRAAFDRFGQLGYPTTRHEQWKYTSVKPITEAAFRLADAPSTPSHQHQLAEYIFTDDEHRMVFVNGRFEPALSAGAALPRGVHLNSLANASAENAATIQSHLARHAGYDDAAFVALNTAFLHDGAFIRIERGVVVEKPIHLMFITQPGHTPGVVHPRVLIIVEDDASATVIETYAGPDGSKYFTNAVTEVVVGEKSSIDHYRIGREGDGAFHIGRLNLHQSRSSNVTSHIATLGGALVRNEINAAIDAEDCNCDIYGVYAASGTQHVDNHLRIDHLKPNCNSRELFKGILDGHATGVFRGRILVAIDAQKTDAKQTSRSLLLSDNARARSAPQLEIFADDVKCTHGATIGQLDEDAMFYMQARGISRGEARDMLIFAFANEAIAEIRHQPIRVKLEALLWERLPHSSLTRGP